MASRLTLKDRAWLRQSFILPASAIDDVDLAQRVMTSASLKFTDTTLGGNFVMNTLPQYCRFADVNAAGNNSIAWAPSIGGFLSSSNSKDLKELGVIDNAFSSSRGMGRYYSEAIDDNAQVVTMRFGVPEFNSLTSFFGNFYDPTASLVARTGRAPGIFASIGKVMGMALALPFQPFIFGGRVIKKISGLPVSKFYYLKPAMPLYFNAAATIANGIAINLGISPRGLTPGQRALMTSPGNEFTEANLREFHELMPDIIGSDGSVNVYALATRAQRIANKYNEVVREKLDKVQASNQADAEKQLRAAMQEMRGELLNSKANFTDNSDVRLDTYVQAYLNIPKNQPSYTAGSDGKNVLKDDTVEAAGDRSQYDMDGDSGTTVSSASTDKSSLGSRLAQWGSSFSEFFKGELRDGASFVSFKVDYSGSTRESFSTSTKPHDLASQLNSTSQQSRMKRIDFADGNLGEGALATAVEGVVGAAKDLAANVLSGFQAAGLMALAGNAFVDIPNVIDTSSAELPRMDYTIQLRSPYGNKLALLRNLYIPLAMLLAGALPISGGRRAYGTPFICEAHCQGRASIRLGVIDSLTVTRGVGNLAWTPQNEALGIDVTLSIVDLSSVIHMPISANYNLSSDGLIGAVAKAGGELVGAVTGSSTAGDTAVDIASYIMPGTYDDDSTFSDYLAVMGSLNWKDMVYTTRNWQLNRMRTIRAFKDQISPAKVAQYAVLGTLPGRLLNAISRDTDRP